VAELRQRLSAQEFTQWMVVLSEQGSSSAGAGSEADEHLSSVFGTENING